MSNLTLLLDHQGKYEAAEEMHWADGNRECIMYSRLVCH